ncbi:MAG: hypothetical protein KatS3mg054_0657 [Chloroflexus sp.]|nr:MAG: hypothetical protein KatS3mg054_0657 [Chloroflexus sp.]
MKSLKVKIEGDKDLKRKLDLLGERARAALLKAVDAGAEVIEEEANRLAPGAHVVRGNQQVEGGTAEISVAPDEAHWYYRFFETGASEHEIKGNPLVFEGDVGLVVTKRVQHTGMAASPFLRPAVDGQKDAAVKRVGDVFRAEIEALSDGS